LSEDNHRKLLDRYGGLEEDVAALTRRFQELSSLKRRYEKMISSERERMREMEILRFAVQEIDDAALKAGEEEELEQEKRILSQHERLFSLLDELYENTAENRGGALGALRTARQAMDGVTQIDGNLSPLAKRLDDAFFELEDVAEEIREYRGRIDFSPDRLEECEERLALIHKLEKKYGDTVEEVLQYREEAQQQLSDLENYEEDKAALQEQIQETEKDVLSRAYEISKRRKEHAQSLQERIEGILKSLGMPKTRFAVTVEPRTNAEGKTSCGAYGIDSVAFRIAPNPGEPLKPLADIASGGEISRVMLAIKTVLAESDRIASLIFDEIDAGIGGEVALAVGEHLHSLAAHKQVLCITHLASIAVRADNHLRVEKRVSNEHTSTEVREVQGDTRVAEIARMLAGDREGQTSRVHAEELLAKYGNVTSSG
jgi:DNA repair protein RecN (Recombination protein N)